MLSLDSPQWSQLHHAYGAASDIPKLIRKLEQFPESGGQLEPWFTIWSALAHQGDVYSASFAAVPHIVRIISTAPTKANSDFFQFAAWVEVCRSNNNVTVPAELLPAYKNALAQLPALVGLAAAREWDEGFLACALGAISAAKGFHSVAEAALELTPSVATDFIEWLHEQ